MNYPSTDIRKVTFIVKDQLQYTFDVNSTTTISELKRLLILGAHLMKKSFRIYGYHDNKDYTDMDKDLMSSLFPNMQQVIFKLRIMEDHKGFGASTMELPDSKFCRYHQYNYNNLYCYNCNLSLCLECLKLNNLHENHYVIEKCEYLTNSQILAERLFLNCKYFQMDSNSYKITDSIKKYSQTLIQLKKFEKLKADISTLESKAISLLALYENTITSSLERIQNNMNLMKKYGVEEIEKLKKLVGIERICIEEKVFLNFDKYYKALGNSMNERLKLDYSSLDYLNEQVPKKLISSIDNAYLGIESCIQKTLQETEFDNLTKEIENRQISIYTKQEIRENVENGDFAGISSLLDISSQNISKDNIAASPYNRENQGLDSFKERNVNIPPEKLAESAKTLFQNVDPNKRQTNPLLPNTQSPNQPVGNTNQNLNFQNQTQNNNFQTQNQQNNQTQNPFAQRNDQNNQSSPFDQRNNQGTQNSPFANSNIFSNNNNPSSPFSNPNNQNSNPFFPKNDTSNQNSNPFFPKNDISNQNTSQFVNQNNQGQNSAFSQKNNSQIAGTNNNMSFGTKTANYKNTNSMSLDVSPNISKVKEDKPKDQSFTLTSPKKIYQTGTAQNQIVTGNQQQQQGAAVFPMGGGYKVIETTQTVTTTYHQGVPPPELFQNIADNAPSSPVRRQNSALEPYAPALPSGGTNLQRQFSAQADLNQRDAMNDNPNTSQFVNNTSQYNFNYTRNVEIIGSPNKQPQQLQDDDDINMNNQNAQNFQIDLINQQQNNIQSTQNFGQSNQVNAYSFKTFGASQGTSRHSVDLTSHQIINNADMYPRSQTGSKRLTMDQRSKQKLNQVNEKNNVQSGGQNQQGQQGGNAYNNLLNNFKQNIMNIGKEDGLIGSNEIEVIAEENEANNNSNIQTATLPFQQVSTQSPAPKSKSKRLLTSISRSMSKKKLMVAESNDKEFLMAPIPKTDKIKFCEGQKDTYERICKFKGTVNDCFNEGCAYCNSENSMYVHGGIDAKTNQFSSAFYKVSFVRGDFEVVGIQESNYPRYHHSLIKVGNDIYAIGGAGFGEKMCEKFDGVKCTWERMHDLTTGRESPILCVWNGYLYAFFGKDKQGNHLNTIERIRLDQSTTGEWEDLRIPYVSRVDLNFALYGSGIIIEDNNALIIGGCRLAQDGDDLISVYSNETFVYDFNEHLISDFDFPFNDGAIFIENQLYPKGYTYYQINTNLGSTVLKIEPEDDPQGQQYNP